MAGQPHPIVEKAMSLMSVVTETAETESPLYVLTDAGSSSVMTALGELSREGLTKAIADLATLAFFLATNGSLSAGEGIAELLEAFVDELEQMEKEGVAGARGASNAIQNFRSFQGADTDPGVLGGDGERPEGATPAGPGASFAMKVPGEE